MPRPDRTSRKGRERTGAGNRARGGPRRPSRHGQDADDAPRRDPPLGDAPRDVICRTLARQARLYPDLDILAVEKAAADLTPQHAAFVHAVCDATVRRWLTLEHLLGRFLTQPFSELEARVRGVLLAGATQVLFMDRVPVHSAINHAVEWAKVTVRPGAGGLVNAVLRRLATLRPEEGAARRETYSDGRDELPAPDGSAIVLAEPVLPEDELSRLSLATSHPRWLLERWLGQMPLREARRLALHSFAEAPVVLNTAHAAAPLPADAPLVPHSAPGHHVWTGSHAALGEFLRSRRDVWVQDAASSLAVAGVGDLRPPVVLDLCAGMGTKTRQLEAVFPEAEIVATDADAARAATLASVFKGSQRVKVMAPQKIREAYLGKADLVLLDVPCSNTGVLARRPEARYRFDAQHLESLAGMQRQIIADSITLLRENPRGRILYSSCSLEPEENQAQAAWAFKWHRLETTRTHTRLPRGAPGGAPHDYTDGSFAALLGT